MIVLQTILLFLAVLIGIAFLIRYWQRQSIEMALDIIWNVVNWIEQVHPRWHTREKHDLAVSESKRMCRQMWVWLPDGLIEAMIEDGVYKQPHAYKPYSTNPSMSSVPKTPTKPIPIVVPQNVPTTVGQTDPKDAFVNEKEA